MAIRNRQAVKRSPLQTQTGRRERERMVEHSRVERAITEVGSLTGHGAQLGDERQTSPK